VFFFLAKVAVFLWHSSMRSTKGQSDYTPLTGYILCCNSWKHNIISVTKRQARVKAIASLSETLLIYLLCCIVIKIVIIVGVSTFPSYIYSNSGTFLMKLEGGNICLELKRAYCWIRRRTDAVCRHACTLYHTATSTPAHPLHLLHHCYQLLPETSRVSDTLHIDVIYRMARVQKVSMTTTELHRFISLSVSFFNKFREFSEVYTRSLLIGASTVVLVAFTTFKCYLHSSIRPR